jgi:hypothetical protein
MGTWYTEDHRWNENFTKELDAMFHHPAMEEVALSLKPESSVIAGRVHGNPFIESCNIGRQASPATMRKQLDVYEAAFASGSDPQSYKDLLANAAKSYELADGGHIMDIDDPMLVEQGEAYIHKQFTDYLSDAAQRDDELGRTLRQYMDSTFIKCLENGLVPPAVVTEPPRQRFGLPYEWHGAKVKE